MTTGAKVFLDSNILIRMVLSQMNQHAAVDALVKRTIRNGAELWISGQVIREFIVQATHPRTLTEPLTIEQVVQGQLRVVVHIEKHGISKSMATQNLATMVV